MEQIQEIVEKEVFINICLDVIGKLIHKSLILFRLDGVILIILPVYRETPNPDSIKLEFIRESNSDLVANQTRIWFPYKLEFNEIRVWCFPLYMNSLQKAQNALFSFFFHLRFQMPVKTFLGVVRPSHSHQ